MRGLLLFVCTSILVLGCGEDARPKPTPKISQALQTSDQAVADVQRNMQFENQVGRRLQNGENVNKVLDDVLAHAKSNP